MLSLLACQSYGQSNFGKSFFDSDQFGHRNEISLSIPAGAVASSIPKFRFQSPDVGLNEEFDTGIQVQYELRVDDARDWTSETPLYQIPIRNRLRPMFSRFGSDFVADQKNFYTSSNFRLVLSAFAIGAATANTPFDESLREVLHDNLVNTPSSEYAEFLHENRHLGDGYFLLPAYTLLALVGKGLAQTEEAYLIGEWSERNIRGMLVGAPVLLLSQSLTGASRPNETGHSSDWTPFQDDNGVSGHAFMGAIPFLTAAKMSKNRWAKAGFYAGSLLPGLSRITDDRHYPSQVFLGWTLAYVATSSVAQTESKFKNVEFAPMLIGSDMGFGFTLRR